MKPKFKIGDHVKVIHKNNFIDDYIINRLAKINWKFCIVKVEKHFNGNFIYFPDKQPDDLNLNWCLFYEHELEKIEKDNNLVCKNKENHNVK